MVKIIIYYGWNNHFRKLNLWILHSKPTPAFYVDIHYFCLFSSASDYSRKYWGEIAKPIVRWIDGQSSLLWEIQDKFEIGCEFDVVWFPFDKQRCSLDLSTNNSPKELVYLSTNSCTDMSKFRPNGEFDVNAAGCEILVIMFLKATSNYGNAGQVKREKVDKQSNLNKDSVSIGNVSECSFS